MPYSKTDILERLDDVIIADAFISGGIRSRSLATHLIHERGDAAWEIRGLRKEVDELRRLIIFMDDTAGPMPSLEWRLSR